MLKGRERKLVQKFWKSKYELGSYKKTHIARRIQDRF